MQNIETFVEKVKLVVAQKAALGNSVKFRFKEGGVVWLEGTDKPEGVVAEDREASCTITISLSDAFSFLEGNFDIVTAYMLGKLKVQGDFSVAMKVVQVMKG